MRGIPVNKETILAKLEPYLKVGLRLNAAVNNYNLEHENDFVVRRTVQDWYNTDNEVRQKIDIWREYGSIMARQVLFEAIGSKDLKASLIWLKLFDEDFSPRGRKRRQQEEYVYMTPTVVMYEDSKALSEPQ